MIETSELKDFSELESRRRELLETAIETAKEVTGMPYLYGGNTPADGGFDCSGAIHFILHKIGLNPPRTSSDQYLWVKKYSEIHTVSSAATSPDDHSLAQLEPGDLIFWSGTYEPNDQRQTKITHVAIFLGYEKKDGRAVMINATNGRSYRGKKGNGFGVYDFRIPSTASKSRIVGYGTPPGLLK
ncbi:C40 family peptidase [Luteolibacter algae]|uniref:C40 family peptidase n=1 Tax=Luteolibacter algae TaxID=454151 RepID=UPI0036D7C2D5